MKSFLLLLPLVFLCCNAKPNIVVKRGIYGSLQDVFEQERLADERRYGDETVADLLSRNVAGKRDNDASDYVSDFEQPTYSAYWWPRGNSQ